MTSKRKVIKLHPTVFEMLSRYKDKIHYFATKNRVPMSWNDFFTIISSDWEIGRSKCSCGMIMDCEACNVEKTLQKIKLMNKWSE